MRAHASLWLLFLFVAFAANAQEQKEVAYALSAKPLYGFMFIHSKDLESFRGTRFNGIQIDLNRYRKDALAYTYAHRKFN